MILLIVLVALLGLAREIITICQDGKFQMKKEGASIAFLIVIVVLGTWMQIVEKLAEKREAKLTTMEGEIIGSPVLFPLRHVNIGRINFFVKDGSNILEEFSTNAPSGTTLQMQPDGTLKEIKRGLLVPEIEKILKRNHVFVRNKNGKVVISARVCSKEGRIFEIVDNEWTAYPKTGGDRNYNEKGIEILDEFGKVIFNARMLSTGVAIQGRFYGVDGAAIAFSTFTNGVAQGSVDVEALSIDPIFVYPSSRNLGVMTEAGKREFTNTVSIPLSLWPH